MKFQLSTLILAIAVFAVAVALYLERCRFASSFESWQAEKQNMKQEFENDFLRLWNGVDSITSSDSAVQFLQKIDDQIIFETSPIDESKEAANEIVVQELVKIWRNRSDIQYSLEFFGHQYPELKNSDWASELARDLWKHGNLSSTKEFFELAQHTELYGEDLSSEEYRSLHEMIDHLAN